MEKSRMLRLKVDMENGRVLSGNKEWILSQPLFFQALHDGIEQSFGSGAWIICMVAGKNVGKKIFEINNEKVDANIKNVSSVLDKLFTRMGWGKIQLEEYSEKK